MSRDDDEVAEMNDLAKRILTAKKALLLSGLEATPEAVASLVASERIGGALHFLAFALGDVEEE